jgi:hypothetical protein
MDGNFRVILVDDDTVSISIGDDIILKLIMFSQPKDI